MTSDFHETHRETFPYHFPAAVKISSHLNKFCKFYGYLCDLGLTIGICTFLPTAADENAVTFFLRMILSQNFQGSCGTK